MIWRPSQFEDFSRIDADSKPDEDVRASLTDTEETREVLLRDARTWEDDGEVLAIIGIAHMWQGVGQVWTLITDTARSRGVALSIGALRSLVMLHGERGYWRIQATVEDGDEVARLWIVALGFQFEGMMRGYGTDGRTHALYSRLRGC